ncbi:uncharacterized protein LOC129959481 isoform X2 [Argiope bruennichi]|uniref:Uncharacterized protein n=1 Tax=Argiope bruennichi TaxID=94029 RepID=A0A8T0F0L0_ARGBR|nr:uncharacterized protein LOC129959481 isoform X2 [Argiope bruennichi]KAF8784666.1 hypothetical protein HNY73_010316 [Argiope bruennichi]
MDSYRISSFSSSIYCTTSILALLVLLSTAPSEGYPTSTISNETTTLPTDEVNDSQSLKVKDLPFANYISNPCSPGTSSRTTDRSRSKAHRQSYTIAFYNYMSSYGTLYKQDAMNVINESTIDDCAVLNLPELPYTPTLSELQEMDAEGALKRIHSSLLMHAAHAYFVEYQYLTSSSTCSEASANRERNLAREAIILARKQKHMACMTQMTIEELGYTPNNTDEILDEKFTNLQLCSRRALRDCQIMLSIVRLFDVIANYSKSILEPAPVPII